jgi:hypothetical protein
MTLESFLGPTSVLGWIGLIVAGVLWFVLTVFILCVMEVSVIFTFLLSSLSFGIGSPLFY